MDISDIQYRLNQAELLTDIDDASNVFRTLLHELAQALDPFPNFLDISTIQAIEIEPVKGINADLGCIVVCPNGEIQELVLRLIPGSIDFGDVEQAEELQAIEFSSEDYITYARSAALQLVKIHQERSDSP